MSSHEYDSITSLIRDLNVLSELMGMASSQNPELKNLAGTLGDLALRMEECVEVLKNGT